MDVFDQSPFACRFQWGPDGIRLAAAQAHILIIIDALVFSTTTIAAVARGAEVFPVGSPDAVADAVARWQAVELPHRRRPSPEGWSHSPASLTGLRAGIRLVYYSPNGATCSAAAQGASAVLTGALVNATAVARAAARLHAETGRPVTVIACGERWPEETLRPSLEDELAAGAIIAAMDLPRSPEAEAVAALWAGCRERHAELLWECAGGRELREKGFPEDVTFAARLDAFDAVPIRNRDGWLTSMG